MNSLFLKDFVFVKVFVCVWILGSSSVYADTMSLNYADFYSHLKKLDDEDTPALQFAFGFIHVESKRLCDISTVNIVTQKQTIEVAVTAENRFQLPTEKALKQARAIVEVAINGNTHQCDMSVQLETKPEFLKSHYSSIELSNLFNQYVLFFDDMGGMLSFLMPNVSGLTLHFEEILPSEVLDLNANTSGITISERKISLSEHWLSDDNKLSLPKSPLRITAITTKD